MILDNVDIGFKLILIYNRYSKEKCETTCLMKVPGWSNLIERWVEVEYSL